MTSLKLDYENGIPALVFSGNGLSTDATFKTAVLMSLLTDARVSEIEAPSPQARGGWWGNSFADIPGYELGSKLWLLKGSRVTDPVLRQAERWAQDALQWMVTDGIATRVAVTAYRADDRVLDLEVYIERPDEPADRWLGTWDATLEG